MSNFQHPRPTNKQMLCQISIHWVSRLAACRDSLLGCRLAPRRCLAGLVLLLLAGQGYAESVSAQDKLLQQVTQWVKLTQQLNEKQFSFAPLDARLQVQGCDRPLALDLPFTSRETVRVRCQSDPVWQLYMRVIFDTSAPALATTKPSEGGAAPARKVVVAARLLRRGTVLTPDLLQEVDHSGKGLDAQVVSSIKDVENSEMVRDVMAGTPLHSHDVRRALLVKQGQSVLLTVTQGSGFAITARVEALQDGKMGEQVRLKNLESGRFLSGVVTGPNAVRGF